MATNEQIHKQTTNNKGPTSSFPQAYIANDKIIATTNINEGQPTRNCWSPIKDNFWNIGTLEWEKKKGNINLAGGLYFPRLGNWE